MSKKLPLLLKTPAVWLVAAACACMMASCTTSVDLVGAARGLKERAEGPPPESEWNRSKIWERVGDDPPTYVPTGYGATANRTDAEGTWFTDARDGKRLFVPNARVGEFSPRVLRGEAAKVTNWTNRQLLETEPGFMAIPGGRMDWSDLPYLIPQSR